MEDEMKLAFFGSDSNADGATNTNTIDTTSNNQESESESIPPEEAEVTVNEPCIVIYGTRKMAENGISVNVYPKRLIEAILLNI